MNTIALLMLLGLIGGGLMVYWGPYLFLSRLRWRRQEGSLRFTWESYSSVEHAEPRWFLIATIPAERGEEKIALKVFPLFADNIFPTLAQLELRVADILKTQSEAPLVAHFHPVFRWVCCVEPLLSETGRHSTYVGFFFGLLLLTASLIGIVLTL